MKIKSFTPLIEVFGNLFTKFQLMDIFIKNLKIFIYLIFLFLNFNNYSHAHMSGEFLSEEDAENKSLELGCEGIHKKEDKWLPCKNEKELHRFLRK